MFTRRGTQKRMPWTGTGRTRLLPLTAALAVLSLCALTAPANAQTIVVDYGSLGTKTQSSPVILSGVTATSSGTFYLDNPLGLGIVGGASLVYIDNTESVLFTFTNGPAGNVMVTPYLGTASSGSAATTLEAFGVGGDSLGVFTYYGFGDPGFLNNPDLSSRVGGAFISSFRITGGSGSGATVKTISYTAAVDPVPEPEEYAVMGMAGMCLCGLMLRARRRRTDGVGAGFVA